MLPKGNTFGRQKGELVIKDLMMEELNLMQECKYKFGVVMLLKHCEERGRKKCKLPFEVKQSEDLSLALLPSQAQCSYALVQRFVIRDHFNTKPFFPFKQA